MSSEDGDGYKQEDKQAGEPELSGPPVLRGNRPESVESRDSDKADVGTDSIKEDDNLDTDTAEVKINAEKVVVEGDENARGEMKGLENEPPSPAGGTAGGAAGSQESGSSSIGSGFQGPLEVDSVGDYLDDKTDWLAIDAAARQKARIAFEARDRANQEEADEAEAKKEEGRKERQRKLAKKAQRWKDRAVEGEEVPKAFADLPRDADNNFISDDGKLLGEEPPALADPGEGKEGEEGNARIPDRVDLSAKSQSFVPNSGPGTPEHVASQRHVDMTDFGVQGPSHYQLNGQNESAVQEAIDLSSDAIKTVTAAVVDTLTDLATVLNQHHDAIQTLRDIVASSGEEDVR